MLGGNFLCKMFDLFTPFSAGLLHLMNNCFDKISIHKPNSSRPANSERCFIFYLIISIIDISSAERFLVCKWKKRDTSAVKEFLSTVNQRFNHIKTTSTNQDIIDIVPWDLLKADDIFLSYLIEANNSLCQRQIYGLAKIAAYCDDTNLLERRQKELRQQCLEFWKIPDKLRSALSG